MYHIKKIHLSIDGHLGSSHILAILNSSAMNSGVKMSFSIPLGICPVVRLLGHMVVLFLVFFFFFFKESPYCSLQWLNQFTFPPTVQERSLFSTQYPACIACRFFDDGHSDCCVVISDYSFDLYFSDN